MHALLYSSLAASLIQRTPRCNVRMHSEHDSRRTTMLSRQVVLTGAAAAIASAGISPAAASGLKAKLDAQDSKLLTKPSGLGAPAEASFPSWLEGEWRGSLSFAGYELPAKDQIARDDLFREVNVPGFAKCSIAFLPDVGKEGVSLTNPPMRWVRDEASGLVREDRVANLRSATRGGLGYDALDRIDYKTDPNNSFGLGSNTGNPNRIKLVFAPGLTKNAERIELFFNSRETEAPSDDLFYVAESIRQVTFSNGQTRQVRARAVTAAPMLVSLLLFSHRG